MNSCLRLGIHHADFSRPVNFGAVIFLPACFLFGGYRVGTAGKSFYGRTSLSKRMTDTEKWFDEWFRKLPPLYKNFWNYLCDRCDPAGVWKKDFELAGILIGETIEEAKATDLFRSRITPLKDGYWLVSGFVPFQYGALKASCRPHRSILSIIERHQSTKGYPKGIERVCNTHKDKEQDKDKEKEQESKDVKSFEVGGKDSKGKGGFVPPTPQEAEAYALSIGFKLDGEAFVAYYEKTDWKIKGQKITRWQSCVVTWKKNDGGNYGRKNNVKLNVASPERLQSYKD